MRASERADGSSGCLSSAELELAAMASQQVTEWTAEMPWTSMSASYDGSSSELAPGTDHKRLNTRLVCTSSYTEVPVLAPTTAPRVDTQLQHKARTMTTRGQVISLILCASGPQESPSWTWPRFVEPFLHSTAAWDRQTPRYGIISCNRPHYARCAFGV